MLKSASFDYNNRWFVKMFIPIRSGPSESDNINRMIQLTVIQLSGAHGIKSLATLLLYFINVISKSNKFKCIL